VNRSMIEYMCHVRTASVKLKVQISHPPWTDAYRNDDPNGNDEPRSHWQSEPTRNAAVRAISPRARLQSPSTTPAAHCHGWRYHQNDASIPSHEDPSRRILPRGSLVSCRAEHSELSIRSPLTAHPSHVLLVVLLRVRVLLDVKVLQLFEVASLRDERFECRWVLTDAVP